MTIPERQSSCATTGVPTLSCLSRTIALGGVLFWVAGALGGLWMVIDDLRVRGEMFDGLGLYLGGAVVFLCLLLAVPWFIARRTQRMAWFWLGVVTTALALVYVAFSRA